ncbi:MAG TPA: TonB C-terminal domain-containing protein [Steroidobacteraceae bacterium]|nr:TonB C-terminal domain-containing protein [Steroidobacteraceae bacterium]
MPGASDSGRIRSGLNPGQRGSESSEGPASARGSLPSCRLVVEDWVPELPAPAPAVPSRPRDSRYDPSRGIPLRLAAALAAILLHAGAGAWLLASSAVPRHSASQALVLIANLPAPRQPPPDLAAELPPPILERVLPTSPKLPALVLGPAEVALSVSASSDVLIGDAAAAAVEDLAGTCRPGRETTSAVRASAIILLVRVERDGHVSDSKIEVGSGRPWLDQAVQQCLIARGSLPPRRINGAPVASWQRVHWPAV